MVIALVSHIATCIDNDGYCITVFVAGRPSVSVYITLFALTFSRSDYPPNYALVVRYCYYISWLAEVFGIKFLAIFNRFIDEFHLVPRY